MAIKNTTQTKSASSGKKTIAPKSSSSKTRISKSKAAKTPKRSRVGDVSFFGSLFADV